jgi:tetratricopeptide (TPR) repeat protein
MLLPGMRALWVLVLSLAILDPARLDAQSRVAESVAPVAQIAAPGAPASPFRRPESEAFLALLGRYEAGDYPGAAAAAARMDVETARAVARQLIDDTDRDMVELRRLKAASKEAPTEGLENELKRERVRRMRLTLLVHTEAAVRAIDVKALGGQLTLAREAAGRLRRLEDESVADGPLNIRVKEAGAAAPSPMPSQVQGPSPVRPEWEATKLFLRDWYLVVASRLQSADQPEQLKRHVREGLELLTDEPELLLTRGTISESEAAAAVVDRSVAGEIYTSDYVHRWRQYMSGAGGDYEAAARRQPDLHEATLRWGRVNALLGDRKAARRAFDDVAASGAPAQLRYMAQLFLADLAEREQQPDHARAAYEAALALFPTAQAPMLALSQLCDSAGESECARRWLSQSMAATGRGRLDPWWAYLRGQAWIAEQRLAAFRARGLQK